MSFIDCYLVVYVILYDSKNFLSFFSPIRISGSGGCVITTCWMDTQCQLVTFGGGCPLILMLLLKGKMGNLLSLKVSLALIYR